RRWTAAGDSRAGAGGPPAREERRTGGPWGPPVRSLLSDSLVDQHHAQRLLLATGLEPGAIDARGHPVPAVIRAAPAHGVVTGVHHAVGDARDAAAGEVEQRQFDALRLRDPEAQRAAVGRRVRA